MIRKKPQRKTIFDCEDGSISDIDAEFDEKELVAITDMLPDWRRKHNKKENSQSHYHIED